MKINGKQIKGPNVEKLYLSRGDEVLEITAEAVLSEEEFNLLVPMPIPPTKIIKGGQRVPNFDAPGYKSQMEEYSKKRANWIIINSIKKTDGLEWDTVDYQDPATWGNYYQDFKSAGLTDIEINQIINTIMTANGLNERKLEEARERFLLQKAEQNAQSTSQKEEQLNTPSGEHVNGSVSSPQV